MTMKIRLLLTFFASLMLLVGCDKETQPATKFIDGIELPPLTEQFAEGSSITIKGAGFTQADKIVFRTQTKATTDIAAEITEVGATQITFVVPAGLSAGVNPIVLKRGGSEQILGSVSIAEPAETPDAKLYGFGLDANEQAGVYEINQATYAMTEIAAFPDGEKFRHPVVIGHVAYGTNQYNIVSFNFDNKTYKKGIEVNGLECLGVIDEKLYALTTEQSGVVKSIVLSSVNTETGALTEVANFGEVDEPVTSWRGFTEMHFTYDAANKTILVHGLWYTDGGRTIAQMALNIETKSIKTLDSFTDHLNGEFFIDRGAEICSVAIDYTDEDNAVTSIYTLNSKYERDKKIASIPLETADILLDTAKDMAYGLTFNSAYLFDFKSSKLTQIDSQGPIITDMVLVR